MSMRKYINIISENTDNVQEYIELAKVNCSDILKLYQENHGKPFYRGVSYTGDTYKNNENIFISKPRLDRLPRDSNHSSHRFMDMGLEILGSPTNRSNSVAITSKPEQADMYGKRYVILPYNGFQYTFSEKNRDFASIGSLYLFSSWLMQNKLVDDEMYTSMASNSELLDYAIANKSITEQYWHFLKEFSQIHIDNDISIALKNGGEVMISNCKFIMLDPTIYIRNFMLKMP